MRARISTAWKTSAFWRAIETCAAKSWTSSNSSGEKVFAETESLDGQDADRATTAAERDDDQAPIGRPDVVPEVVDAGVVALVADEDRLVVVDDPGRDPGLARLPRLEVVGGVDAAGGDRRQDLGRRVHDLDRDVVAADQPAEPVGDALEDAARVEGGQDRFGDLEELALAAQLLLERERLLAQPFGRVGVGHRLGGQARVDDEQPQVVVGEAVEPQLREDEDAEDLVVEDHRRQEHRFVEVVLGPRDRVGARIRSRVAQVLRDPVDRDPAGDALAHRHPELVRRLVDVFADLAKHRDGDEVLADHPVDAGVVVVDQLAQLGRDRPADVGDARQAAEARAELLDRLELGGPRRHPLEILGSPDRHAGLRRERANRLEFVVRPVVRLVVVDVEHPEQVAAIEQWGGAERVEALLDDGRADTLATWIIGIADREEGAAGDDGGGREGARREFADAVEVAGRESATDLGDGLAIGPLEEDGGAVALEQDHRVVDQPRQDPIEVEPAADVARDAAQRLGAVEEVGDLLGSLGAADDRAEPFGGDPRDLEVARTERSPRLADDEQDAPRPARARDGHRELGAVIGQDGQCVATVVAVQQEAGHRGPAASIEAPGELERLAEDPIVRGEVDEPDRSGEVRGRDGPWRKAIALGFPGRHEVMPVGIAERADRGPQGLVRIFVDVDQAGDRRGHAQVEMMPFGIERVGRQRDEIAPGGRGEPRRRRWIDPSPAAALPDPHGRDAVRGPGLRRRHEALEVTESIAPVAPRVDPVVPQPAGVAPGPDRVRVDAKKPGGLGDRQGGVRRPGRKGDRHGS